MRKLILAALGYAAWRWLNAPSPEQSSPQRDAVSPPRPPKPAASPRRVQPARAPSAPAQEEEIPEKQGRAGKVTYRVVEHDGGWAYKVGDVFSQTYGTHDAALEAANAAAEAQQMAGEPQPIEYQDETGQWRQEDSDGKDRPVTGVEDTQPRMG